MGRAVTWVSGALAAAAAGAFAPAFASEANLTVITKEAPSHGGTLDLPPTRGFGFVTISDKPPSLVDYTILDLINLATPWPREEEVAQAGASAPIKPNVPIAKPKPKPNPKPKPKPEAKSTKPKPQKQPSWLTADWWRDLTSLRMR